MTLTNGPTLYEDSEGEAPSRRDTIGAQMGVSRDSRAAGGALHFEARGHRWVDEYAERYGLIVVGRTAQWEWNAALCLFEPHQCVFRRQGDPHWHLYVRGAVRIASCRCQLDVAVPR